MSRQAFTEVLQDSGARQPGGTVIRLLLRRPRRLTLALGAFVLKETPVWVLPVITARVIDVVAEGGEVREVLGWFALALGLLVQNYPNHLVYVRNFIPWCATQERVRASLQQISTTLRTAGQDYELVEQTNRMRFTPQ